MPDATWDSFGDATMQDTGFEYDDQHTRFSYASSHHEGLTWQACGSTALLSLFGRRGQMIEDEDAIFDRFEYLRSVRQETKFNIYSGFRVWVNQEPLCAELPPEVDPGRY